MKNIRVITVTNIAYSRDMVSVLKSESCVTTVIVPKTVEQIDQYAFRSALFLNSAVFTNCVNN